MITLGVTGGLASGKSTACRILQDKGAAVFDADQVAKKILFNSPDMWRKLENKFNSKISTKDGIDKKSLAQIAFSSKKNQQVLNNAIHPEVKERFREFVALQKNKNLVVADVALLFESNFEELLDHTLVIICDRKIRFERAQKRGNLTAQQIKKRMELQMPDNQKRKRASFVIENNGTIEELREKIDKLYKQLLISS